MLHRKPFTLFKRKKIYYCYFALPDGSRSTPKSTGETAKGRAETWAIRYLQDGNGQIVIKENVTLQGFSKDFFKWAGRWATDKHVRGLRISERQCQEKTAILQNRIIPKLGNLKLSAITRTVIKDFRDNMFKNDFSGESINKTLDALRSILEAAEEQSLIRGIPQIDRAAKNPKRKGILTHTEASLLFSFPWMTKPSCKHPARSLYIEQVGNLILITTGARISEIQGLTLQDIDLENNCFVIRRAWENRLHRLNRETKNQKQRKVFFTDILKSHLVKLTVS